MELLNWQTRSPWRRECWQQLWTAIVVHLRRSPMRNHMAGHWSMIIIYFRNDKSIPSIETEDEEVVEDIYYHDNWESCKIYQWNNQRKPKFTISIHCLSLDASKEVSRRLSWGCIRKPQLSKFSTPGFLYHGGKNDVLYFSPCDSWETHVSQHLHIQDFGHPNDARILVEFGHLGTFNFLDCEVNPQNLHVQFPACFFRNDPSFSPFFGGGENYKILGSTEKWEDHYQLDFFCGVQKSILAGAEIPITPLKPTFIKQIFGGPISVWQVPSTSNDRFLQLQLKNPLHSCKLT